MSLAALAVAMVAATSRWRRRRATAIGAAIASAQALAIQNQLNFTRENEYEADRIGFQRLDARGLRPRGRRGVHGAAAEVLALRRRQRALLPAHAPDHATSASPRRRRARRRGPTGRSPTRSTSSWCARCCEATRARRRGGRVVRHRDRRAQVQQRGRGAVRPGGVAAARPRFPRAKPSSRRSRRAHRPPMIEAMAGHVMIEAGEPDAAVARFEAALAVSQQDAARLRLSGGADRAGRAPQATAFVEAQLQRFPQMGGCTGSRRRPMPSRARGRSSTSTWASTTRGRATCVRSQLELATRATTATSTRLASSRRGCARCARSSRSSRRWPRAGDWSCSRRGCAACRATPARLVPRRVELGRASRRCPKVANPIPGTPRATGRQSAFLPPPSCNFLQVPVSAQARSVVHSRDPQRAAASSRAGVRSLGGRSLGLPTQLAAPLSSRGEP